MKYGLICALLFLAGLAYSQKGELRPTINVKGKVTKPYTTVTSDDSYSNVEGTVRVTQLCTYIEVEAESEVIRYFPTNLPAEYIKDALVITFDCKKVEAEYPADCNIAAAILLDNVR